jgi:hypothetical protein
LRLGRIVATDGLRVMVEFDGGSGATLARLAIAADAARIQEAAAKGALAVLAFEIGDLRTPIVLGLVWPPAGPAPVEDRKRVLIEAEHELVLQCGKASVTLRKNGRVVIRGTHVESDSEGTNRIKGGQVRIN